MDQYKALLALCAALAAGGVEDVVISPGSRSTPLALAFAAVAGIARHVLLDERSASYFALGLAKASGRPVALVCTSGTAAANFHPAVVEARHGHVPLILLTADRPRELRDVGAAQTIDQVGLYGRDAKWFSDLPVGETPAEERYAAMAGARASAVASAAPAGPVHINVPLREPLLPQAPLHAAPHPPALRPAAAERRPPRDALAQAARLLQEPRAVIVAGPLPSQRPLPDLGALSARTGLPLLADPLSGLRYRDADALAAYDLYLRDPGMREALQPKLVVRVGALPTSKSLGSLLAGAERQILLTGEEAWSDPLLGPGLELPGDAQLAAQDLLGLLPQMEKGAYAGAWHAADRAARTAAENWMRALEEPFDGAAIATLRDLLRPEDILFVGSSMPVRDLDGFTPAADSGPRVLANRGANGIDGVVSSALGAAAAQRRGRTALAIGDLSFYHDQNGLLAAKRGALDLAVLLLHNDGGGIFSFLPQAGRSDFEEFFGTPHGLDFAPVVQMHGGSYVRPRGPGELRSALQDALTAPGLHVVEVRTTRERNVALHAEAFAAASAAARAALGLDTNA